MTRAVYDRAKGILQAMGHAEYAESGKDIVCAAVSTITQAAAISALKCGGEALCGEGIIHTECMDDKHLYVLEVLAEMLEEVSKQYPQHVTLIRAGR